MKGMRRAAVVPIDQPMPWVAPCDIADVAVGRLLNHDWSGRVLQGVHGPVDVTWQQTAAVVADTCGRPVRAERIPDDQMREDLASTGMARSRRRRHGISTGPRDGFVPDQPRTPETTTPTTLTAWCHDELRPAL